MKAMKTVRLIMAVAGVMWLADWPARKGPAVRGCGPGFGKHRPPMERALGLAGGQGGGGIIPNIVKQLKLTDDQRKAMDGILQDHRMKLIDLQANLEKAEVAMGPLMKADSRTRAAIRRRSTRSCRRGPIWRKRIRFFCWTSACS